MFVKRRLCSFLSNLMERDQVEWTTHYKPFFKTNFTLLWHVVYVIIKICISLYVIRTNCRLVCANIMFASLEGQMVKLFKEQFHKIVKSDKSEFIRNFHWLGIDLNCIKSYSIIRRLCASIQIALNVLPIKESANEKPCSSITKQVRCLVLWRLPRISWVWLVQKCS